MMNIEARQAMAEAGGRPGLLDAGKLAKDIPKVAAALRNEGLSGGMVRAALLSLCGVKVDDSLVRHLMRVL